MTKKDIMNNMNISNQISSSLRPGTQNNTSSSTTNNDTDSVEKNWLDKKLRVKDSQKGESSTYYITPKNKQRLKKEAKKYGYKSVSQFLNKLAEILDDAD